MAAAFFLIVLAFGGLVLVTRAGALCKWLVRTYSDPQVTAHLQVAGFVLSLRLIGVGLALGSVLLLFISLHR